MYNRTAVIILAAGTGSRFKTSRNKMVFDLMGKPVFSHVLDCAKTLSSNITAVLGHHNEKQVMDICPGLDYIIQEKPLGTGDALIRYHQIRGESHGDDEFLLILLGDVPLVSANTLSGFIEYFRKEGLKAGFISTRLDDPRGYGRVIRNQDNFCEAIREEKELKGKERELNEINTGIFLFRFSFLGRYLPYLEPHSHKGEYYITDLVEISARAGERTGVYYSPECREFMGINSLKDLNETRNELRKHINQRHMENGVDIIDPQTVFIDIEAEIGKDCVIFPNNMIKGSTKIGEDCFIGPCNYIENSCFEKGVRIHGHCHIKDSTVGSYTSIGPFAHLRMNNRISGNARIGNYVEIKKSFIGEGSKVPHLSYVGDAEVGKNVNIGAGVITCNYDGEKKHPTAIHDNAFIGSDSQLVAPVTIGEGAYVASGSTIVVDVPPYALGISRARQKNKDEWVKKRKA